MITLYIFKIHHSLFEPDDFTTRKCDELSEYTYSARIEVEDLSSRCVNGSIVYNQCGHVTRQLHPSCTACRRTANLPGLA